MTTLVVTVAFEGAGPAGLVPGRPVEGVSLEVGGPGRDSSAAVTDAAGTATVELPDEGSWTVAGTKDVEGGSLLGLMTAHVAGPMAFLALPVRFRPA